MRTAKLKNYDNYLIYENGKVFNIKTQKWLSGSNPEINGGYTTYGLTDNTGKCKGKVGQKWMMMAFYGYTEEFLESWHIHHKNHIRDDNHLDNLELKDPSSHATETHLGKKHLYTKKRVIGKSLPKDFWETTTEEWIRVPKTNNFWCNKKGDFVNKKTNRYTLGTDINGKYLDMWLKEDKILKVRCKKHILLYKIFIGEIPQGYQIHHKDFNSHNDCIDNLQCLTKQEHQKIHAEQRKNKIPNKLIKKLYNKNKTTKKIAKITNLKQAQILKRLKEILPQEQYTKEITKDIRYFLDDIIFDYINGMSKTNIIKKYKIHIDRMKKYITKEEWILFTQINKQNQKPKYHKKNRQRIISILDNIILDYTNGIPTTKIRKKYKIDLNTIKKYITKEEWELFKQISENNRKLKKQQEILTK